MDEEELAIELADAIESCLDIEKVECMEESATVLVTMAGGERFRITVAHAKARPARRDDDEEEEAS